MASCEPPGSWSTDHRGLIRRDLQTGEDKVLLEYGQASGKPTFSSDRLSVFFVGSLSDDQKLWGPAYSCSSPTPEPAIYRLHLPTLAIERIGPVNALDSWCAAASPDDRVIYYNVKAAIYAMTVATGRSEWVCGNRTSEQHAVMGACKHARFREVQDLAVSGDGRTLFVADRKAHKIFQISLSDRSVSLLAGSGVGTNRGVDGFGAAASIPAPQVDLLFKLCWDRLWWMCGHGQSCHAWWRC
eukprot:1360668-Rhodomonas_salina.2